MLPVDISTCELHYNIMEYFLCSTVSVVAKKYLQLTHFLFAVSRYQKLVLSISSSFDGKQLWLYFYEMMYDVIVGIVIISIIYADILVLIKHSLLMYSIPLD